MGELPLALPMDGPQTKKLLALKAISICSKQNGAMFTRILKLPTEPKKSCFLFGPRGTGKTSWLKATFPEALYLDLLSSDLYIDGIQVIPIAEALQNLPRLLNEFKSR
jgi:predicted AAA+ superfamily ATPase